MPGIERQGDMATCGHPNTGSSDVFADGKGVTRIGVDSAGGPIVGPGMSTVLVNGSPVSLPGDSIASHGDPPHSSAMTANPSTTVFAG
jgi:uncharacterized Zn-binding protein involved in type VI secretion